MTEREAPLTSGAEEVPPPQHWKRRQRDIANVVWVSFLMAAVATMVFFAMVDPELLSGETAPGWEISRETGYAIGFFMFWALTAASCILSVFLVRTEHRAEDIPGMKARMRAARKRKKKARRKQRRKEQGRR